MRGWKQLSKIMQPGKTANDQVWKMKYGGIPLSQPKKKIIINKFPFTINFQQKMLCFYINY